MKPYKRLLRRPVASRDKRFEHVEQRSGRLQQRNRLDAPEWSAFTPEERGDWSRNAVAVYFRRIVEAMDAGTFDADDERHFTWDALSLVCSSAAFGPTTT